MTSSSEGRKRRRKKNNETSRKRGPAKRRKILIKTIKRLQRELKRSRSPTTSESSESSESSADSSADERPLRIDLSSDSSAKSRSSSPKRHDDGNRSGSSRRPIDRTKCRDRSDRIKYRKMEDGSRRLSLKIRRGRRRGVKKMKIEDYEKSESDRESTRADKIVGKKEIEAMSDESEKTTDEEKGRRNEKLTDKEIGTDVCQKILAKKETDGKIGEREETADEEKDQRNEKLTDKEIGTDTCQKILAKKKTNGKIGEREETADEENDGRNKKLTDKEIGTDACQKILVQKETDEKTGKREETTEEEKDRRIEKLTDKEIGTDACQKILAKKETDEKIGEREKTTDEEKDGRNKKLTDKEIGMDTCQKILVQKETDEKTGKREETTEEEKDGRNKKLTDKEIGTDECQKILAKKETDGKIGEREETADEEKDGRNKKLTDKEIGTDGCQKILEKKETDGKRAEREETADDEENPQNEKLTTKRIKSAESQTHLASVKIDRTLLEDKHDPEEESSCNIHFAKTVTGKTNKFTLVKNIFSKGKDADDDGRVNIVMAKRSSISIDDKSLTSVYKTIPLDIKNIDGLLDEDTSSEDDGTNADKLLRVNALDEKKIRLDNKSSSGHCAKDISDTINVLAPSSDRENNCKAIPIAKNIYARNDVAETDEEKNNNSEVCDSHSSCNSKPVERLCCAVARKSYSVKNIHGRLSKKAHKHEKTNKNTPESSDASESKKDEHSSESESQSHDVVVRKSYAMRKIHDKFKKTSHNPMRLDDEKDKSSLETSADVNSSEGKCPIADCQAVQKSSVENDKLEKILRNSELLNDKENQSSPESSANRNAPEEACSISHRQVVSGTQKPCVETTDSEDKSRSEINEDKESSKDSQGTRSTAISQSTKKSRRSYEIKKGAKDFSRARRATSEPKTLASYDDMHIVPRVSSSRRLMYFGCREASLTREPTTSPVERSGFIFHDNEEPKISPRKKFYMQKIRKRNDSGESSSEALESEGDESAEDSHGFKKLKRSPAFFASQGLAMENPGGKITVQSIVTLSRKVITVHTESAREKIGIKSVNVDRGSSSAINSSDGGEKAFLPENVGLACRSLEEIPENDREIGEEKNTEIKIDTTVDTTDSEDKTSEFGDLSKVDENSQIGGEKKTDKLPIVLAKDAFKKIEDAHCDKRSTAEIIDRDKKISEDKNSSSIEMSTQIDPEKKTIKDLQIDIEDSVDEEESLDGKLATTSYVSPAENMCKMRRLILETDLILKNDKSLPAVGDEEADKCISIEDEADRDEHTKIDKFNRSTSEILQVQSVAEIGAESTSDKTLPIATDDKGAVFDDKSVPTIEIIVERITDEVLPISSAIATDRIVGFAENFAQSVIDEILPISTTEKKLEKIYHETSDAENVKGTTVEARIPSDELKIDNRSLMENIEDSSENKILPLSLSLETAKKKIRDVLSFDEKSTIVDKPTLEKIADQDLSVSKAEETRFFSLMEDSDEDSSLCGANLTLKEMDSSIRTDEYASMMDNIAEGDDEGIDENQIESSESSDKTIESDGFSMEFVIIRGNTNDNIFANEAEPEEDQDLLIAPPNDPEKESNIKVPNRADDSSGENVNILSDVPTSNGSSSSIIEKIEEIASPIVLETNNKPTIDEPSADDQKKSMSIFSIIKRFFGPDEDKDTDEMEESESQKPMSNEIDPGIRRSLEENPSMQVDGSGERDLPLTIDDVGKNESMNRDEPNKQMAENKKSNAPEEVLPGENSSMIYKTENREPWRKIDEAEENANMMSCDESDNEMTVREKSDPARDVRVTDDSSVIGNAENKNPNKKIDETEHNKSMNCEESEIIALDSKQSDVTSGVLIDDPSICQEAEGGLKRKIDETCENESVNNEISENQISRSGDICPGENISMIDETEDIDPTPQIDKLDTTKIFVNDGESDKTTKIDEIDLLSEFVEISGTEIDTETDNRGEKSQSSLSSINNSEELDETSKVDESPIDPINPGISDDAKKSSFDDKIETARTPAPSIDETASIGEETPNSNKSISIDVDKTSRTDFDINNANRGPVKSDPSSEELARSKSSSTEDSETKGEASTVILRADVSSKVNIDDMEVSDHDAPSSNGGGIYTVSRKIQSTPKQSTLPTCMDIDDDAQSKIDESLRVVITEDTIKDVTTKERAEGIEFSNITWDASSEFVGPGSDAVETRSAEIDLKTNIEKSFRHSSEQPALTDSTEGVNLESVEKSKNDPEHLEIHRKVPVMSCDVNSLKNSSVESFKAIDSTSVVTENIVQNDVKLNDGNTRPEEIQLESRMDESAIVHVEDTAPITRAEHADPPSFFSSDRALAADAEAKSSTETSSVDCEEKNRGRRKTNENVENVLEASINQQANSPIVSPNLVANWMKIMNNGLDENVEENLTKKYLEEVDTNFPTTRSLSRELKAHMSEISLTRDRRYVSTQQRLVAALTALGRAATEVGKKNLSSPSLETTINEAGQILANLHHKNCAERRSYILPELGVLLGAVTDKTLVDYILYEECDRDDQEIDRNSNEKSNEPSLGKSILKTVTDRSRALRVSTEKSATAELEKNANNDLVKKIGGGKKSFGTEKKDDNGGIPMKISSAGLIEKSRSKFVPANNEEIGWRSVSLPIDGSKNHEKNSRSPSSFSDLCGISEDFLDVIEKWKDEKTDDENVDRDDSSVVEIDSSEPPFEISEETPALPKESITDLLTREMEGSTQADNSRTSKTKSDKIGKTENEKTHDEKMDFEDCGTTTIGSGESPIEIFDEIITEPEESVSDTSSRIVEDKSEKSGDQLDECIVTFARTVQTTSRDRATKNSNTHRKTSSYPVVKEKQKIAEKTQIRVKNFALENQKDFAKDSSIASPDECEETNECVVTFSRTKLPSVAREAEKYEDTSSKTTIHPDSNDETIRDWNPRKPSKECHRAATQSNELRLSVRRRSLDGQSDKRMTEDSSTFFDDIDRVNSPLPVQQKKFGTPASGSASGIQGSSHAHSLVGNFPKASQEIWMLWMNRVLQARSTMSEVKKSNETAFRLSNRHTTSHSTLDNCERDSIELVEPRMVREYPKPAQELRSRADYFPSSQPNTSGRSDQFGQRHGGHSATRRESTDWKRKSEELLCERRSSSSRSDRSAGSDWYAALISQETRPEASTSEKIGRAIELRDSSRRTSGQQPTAFGESSSVGLEPRQRSEKECQDGRSTLSRSEWLATNPLTASDKYEHRFGQLSALKKVPLEKPQKSVHDSRSEYFPVPTLPIGSSSAIDGDREYSARDRRGSVRACPRPSISSRSAPVDRPRSVQDESPVVARSLEDWQKENTGLGSGASSRGRGSDRRRTETTSISRNVSRSSIVSEKLHTRLSGSERSTANEFVSNPFLRPLYQAMPGRSEELEAASSTKTDRPRSTIAKIPEAWGTVKVQAKGAGYAILQMTVQYNVDIVKYQTPPPVKAFDLRVRPNFYGRNQSHITYFSCQRWTNINESSRSGMAVLDVTIPTGYIIQQQNLDRYILSRQVRNLQRARFQNRKVLFYFDYLDQEETCVNFTIERWYPVANMSRYLPVRVYDYYAPERFNETIFDSLSTYVLNICEVCGSSQCPYCHIYNAATLIGPPTTFVLLLSVFTAIARYFRTQEFNAG